jgi:hypothetical protein
MITFVLDSLIHGPGHPERKKMETIFLAIPIFVPKHLGSVACPPPWDLHPDSPEGTFPTAATTPLAHPNAATVLPSSDLLPSLVLSTTADTLVTGIIIQSPPLAMDDIFHSGSGSFCYRDVCSSIAKGIREEMVDPKIDMFCNLQPMIVDKIEKFDPKLGWIVEDIDGGLVRINVAKDGHTNRTNKKRTGLY